MGFHKIPFFYKDKFKKLVFSRDFPNYALVFIDSWEDLFACKTHIYRGDIYKDELFTPCILYYCTANAGLTQGDIITGASEKIVSGLEILDHMKEMMSYFWN